MKHKRSDFPQGFQFAAATSSYQIEGHGFGGAGQTHWDSFAATPGNVVRNEHGQIACDHYHRMDEDLDLCRDLGLDAYRFSTSWARVLPEGRGQINQEGLDFYDRLVDGCLARGLNPMATLYHWELPSTLADEGGWRNADIGNWFADFTEIIMSRIGDRVFSVAPINEPWCVSWLSHFEGHHAPGLRDIRATARAMHHVMVAHGRATQVMRGLGVKNLGAVMNFEYAFPAQDSPEARLVADRYDAIYNRFFLGGIFDKAYPDLVLEGIEDYLPKGWENDFDTIAEPLDWVGINYYTCKRVAPMEGAWPGLTGVPGPLPKTQMDWEIYPEGLYHFINQVHQANGQNLPIYITESGMAHPSEQAVSDTPRTDYIDAHLGQTLRAINEGVPVKGFTYWSLFDNYEWALGYEKRFGLVHVDFDTLKRTPKASYHALAKALAS